MAVHIPAMVVFGALKAIQNQADNHHAKIISSEQLKRDVVAIKRLEIELKAQDARHAREVEMEDRQRDREASVLMRMTEMSENLAQWKTDAILEVFRGIKDILLEEQRVLGNEKAALVTSLTANGKPDEVAFVMVQSRQQELDEALAENRQAALQLGDTVFSVVSAIEPTLDNQTKSAIEDLRIKS
jgi:hypothetical protein